MSDKKRMAIVGVGSSLALESVELAIFRAQRTNDIGIVVMDANSLDFEKQVKEMPIPLIHEKVFELKTIPPLGSYEQIYNDNPRSKKRKRSKPR